MGPLKFVYIFRIRKIGGELIEFCTEDYVSMSDVYEYMDKVYPDQTYTVEEYSRTVLPLRSHYEIFGK